MSLSHARLQDGIAYLAALSCLLVLDGLWLTVLMGATYQQALAPLALAELRLEVAAVFYLLYPIGIVVFGVKPGLVFADWRRSAAPSALFGLLAYATYDLSNLATLKDWPFALALIDIGWGALLSGTCGAFAYAAARAWGRRARH